MKKNVSLFVVVLLLVSVVLAPNVFAQENNAKKSLVALGDSITFGYDLENNLSHVSKEAYPQLMGEEFNYRVRNLAVSGWDSEDLLNAVCNDNKYRNAIKNADLLTLNIGGNDVLGYLATAYLSNTPIDFNEIGKILDTYYTNLGYILQEIRTLNPTVPILFYGFYNPVAPSSQLFNQAFPYNYFIMVVDTLNIQILNGDDNPMRISYSTYFGNIYYVDALMAFETYNSGDKSDLLVDLVHPSELGQQELFEAAKDTIEDNNLIPQ